MLTQKDFFEKYNININTFQEAGLNWKDLEIIYDDYLKFKEELEPTAIMLFNKLMKSKKVHSVRYRIKDPEHLIEKIIRKRVENNTSYITIENYKEQLTDLLGLRVLHLFKEDWEVINDFIVATWNLKQKPVANYRKGDAEQIIDFFTKKGCETKEHKYGYRSVHYIIETQPGKQKHYGEIQIRTIFEEAWTEIDHTLRYPYDLENPLFSQFLLILNRLSGSADEMGSFIQSLKLELEERSKIFNKQMQEKDRIISDLEKKMEKLNIQGEELKEVRADLKKLKDQKIKGTFLDGGILDQQRELSNLLEASKNISKLSSTFNLLEKMSKPFTFTPVNPEILNPLIKSLENSKTFRAVPENFFTPKDE